MHTEASINVFIAARKRQNLSHFSCDHNLGETTKLFSGLHLEFHVHVVLLYQVLDWLFCALVTGKTQCTFVIVTYRQAGL